MSKKGVTKKVIAEPDVNSEVDKAGAEPVEVAKVVVNVDYEQHPKFDKFKNPKRGE